MLRHLDNGELMVVSMSSRVDFLANLPVKLEGIEGQVTSVGSGLKLQDLFAILDPATRFWKTPQESYLTTEGKPLEKFLKTYPRGGMMRSGRCYRLRSLGHRISGIGFGYWPTPTASDSKRLSFTIEHCRNHMRNQEAKGRKATLSLVEAMMVAFGLRPTAEFGEWLMRYPKDWTDITPSAILSFPNSPNTSASASLPVETDKAA